MDFVTFGFEPSPNDGEKAFLVAWIGDKALARRQITKRRPLRAAASGGLIGEGRDRVKPEVAGLFLKECGKTMSWQ
ncbi:hypothetical protein JQK88_21525 [Mesorhizobium caraganae]|uniref:hypothetical protein n=1 Tax=Mesorhizobium caraganae TaxID=483206 RepID=UPI0019393F5A|nr:hypothetical protein [Mesorhizobium caraganae]MBM2713746.1 hypothetical protein [Mesorhizobium caraganae]